MNAVTSHPAADLDESESESGLASSLQSVHIEGELEGLLLRITTRQHYKNQRKSNLEAVYTFPLPWGATLLGLNAQINGQRLQGTVLEKKQATQRYEKAIDEGDTPIMVERSESGLYSANLGNLKPGEEADIEIEYAQLLRFEQGHIRITLPTTVGPRYGDAHATGGLAPHESVSASVLTEYPLTVNITLNGEVAKAQVHCLSHTVAVSHTETATVVSLQQGGFLDRDFVLILQGLQGQSFASVAPDGEAFAVLASFCPALPDKAPQPVLLKVLVDCSGSMGGDSIAAARRALHEVLKELGDQDWISYSRFGSNVRHELPALQPCNAKTLKQVAKLVDATDADLGGTEMNQALTNTFELGMNQKFKGQITPQRQTQGTDVLLITDGDIWDVGGVIASARSSGHRLFVIGVGSSPTESLLRQLAQETGGACELVSPNQDVADAIVRMFRRMHSARCTSLRVDWGQPALWQSALPMALYGGDTLHLCARLASLPTTPPQLSWVAKDTPMQVQAHQVNPQADPLLARLVAAQQVNQCDRTDKSRKQALELALNYQLVTDQTNLILVHVRQEGEKAEGLPDLDQVQHMLAAGWGGVGSVNEPLVSYSRRAMHGISMRASAPMMPSMDDLAMLAPTVWRNRSVASAKVDALSSVTGDDFVIPAFIRKATGDDDSSPKAKKTPTPQAPTPQVPTSQAPRPQARKLPPGTAATPLLILQTFEASVQDRMGSQRFVSALQALDLPAQMETMLDELIKELGTGAKAWALVVQWLAQRLAGQFTLSRQGERQLRQVLKSENAALLQKLKETWADTVDGFVSVTNQILTHAPTSD